MPAVEPAPEPTAEYSNQEGYQYDGQNDNGGYADSAANQDYGGNDMQGVQSWDNNQYAQGQVGQNQDLDEGYDKPIGIKEDG